MKQSLLALLLLAPFSARAVLIDTSIGAYDVTAEFIHGSLLPEGQPWVGNEPLAIEFAALVGDAFGLPNRGTGHVFPVGGFCDPEISCVGDFGPLFAIAGQSLSARCESSADRPPSLARSARR